MNLYITIYEMVWDFMRSDKDFTVNLYSSESEARLRYWELVAQSKEKLKDLYIPTDDDEEEWIEESSSDKWELYLSGSWAEYRFVVIIKELNIN